MVLSVYSKDTVMHACELTHTKKNLTSITTNINNVESIRIFTETQFMF